MLRLGFYQLFYRDLPACSHHQGRICSTKIYLPASCCWGCIFFLQKFTWLHLMPRQICYWLFYKNLHAHSHCQGCIFYLPFLQNPPDCSQCWGRLFVAFLENLPAHTCHWGCIFHLPFLQKFTWSQPMPRQIFYWLFYKNLPSWGCIFHWLFTKFWHFCRNLPAHSPTQSWIFC